MMCKFKVTVYETIMESFDCEIEIEAPDDETEKDINDKLSDAVEHRRINGEDERQFLEVSDVDWKIIERTHTP